MDISVEQVRRWLERGFQMDQVRRMLSMYGVDDIEDLIHSALDPEHGTEADGPLPDGRRLVQAWGSTEDLPGISGGSWLCKITVHGDVRWTSSNLAPHLNFPAHGEQKFEDEQEALAFFQQRRATLAKALEDETRDAILSLSWGESYLDRRDEFLSRVPEMVDRGARVLSYSGEDLGPFEPEA